MLLVCQLDRVAALLAVEVVPRARSPSNEHLAGGVARDGRQRRWLPGMTPRSYVVSVLDEERTRVASVPRGEDGLELFRDPIDIEADEDGSDKAKRRLCSSRRRLPSKRDSRSDLPLVERAINAMVIKGYAADSELWPRSEYVEKALGPISTPQGNHQGLGRGDFDGRHRRSS